MLYGGSAFAEQRVDRGCDVFGLQLAEARQAGKIEQRVKFLGRSVHFTARAARTQFSRSMAMVIGPTPPGTGVIEPATAAAVAKSTSPQSEPSESRFTPTS